MKPGTYLSVGKIILLYQQEGNQIVHKFKSGEQITGSKINWIVHEIKSGTDTDGWSQAQRLSRLFTSSNQVPTNIDVSQAQIE